MLCGRATRHPGYRGLSDDNPPWFVAFLVRASDAEVAIVDLGPAARIDELVGQWRLEASRGASQRGIGIATSTASAGAEQRYRAVGIALRTLVWDPVADRLGDNVRQIFVIPDGSMALVNLDAMPMGKKDYLVEKGPLFHYLSAERDIVSSDRQEEGGLGLLAIGGPDFETAEDLRTCLTQTMASIQADRRRGQIEDFDPQRFDNPHRS